MFNLLFHPNIDNSLFLNGLKSAFDLIHKIEDCEDAEICIDFCDLKFVSPLFLLTLLVYINNCGKKVQYQNVSSYMSTVYFDEGLKPDCMRRTAFIAQMEKYSSRTYIPIINFPASRNDDDDKNAFLSTVESILARQLKIQDNILAGIKYLISETVDNITEHSESERGYIVAQAYPKGGYLDLCIADCGITLLGSYENQSENEIESDLEAIQAANRGISTKNLPEAENRGYGIITSKKMLIDGLSGTYVMMSGRAMHVKSSTVDNFLELPKLKLNGTIVALRIPFQNNNFQYLRYIE